MSNRIIAQCLQTLLWKNRIKVVEYIIEDRVNKENVDEFSNEFENYVKKSERFNYEELDTNGKLVYNMLTQIKK